LNPLPAQRCGSLLASRHVLNIFVGVRGRHPEDFSSS
jgi:hypothetical protein